MQKKIFAPLRFTLFSLLSLLLVACASPPAPVPGALPSVTVFKPKLFDGVWYEISELPSKDQLKCVCTTSQFRWMLNHFEILTKCWQGTNSKGRLLRIKARAKPTLLSHKTKYKLYLPNGKRIKYRVFYLTDQYQYALLGTMDHQHLWILSRTLDISDHDYQRLLAVAVSFGFDVSKLKMVDQSC